MDRKTWLFSLLFMIAVAVPFITWAEATKTVGSPEAREGRAYLEEEATHRLTDEPSHHFHLARENFLRKDFQAAAKEIHKGLVFLKIQTSRATADGKAALTASISELEGLANDVEKGSVASAKKLDDSFARAHLALAKHHYLKASESWTQKAAQKTGHELEAAASHLEHALAWAGHELEALTIKVLDDTRLLAGKLIKGTEWSADEVGKAISELGKEIEKIAGKMKPQKK